MAARKVSQEILRRTRWVSTNLVPYKMSASLELIQAQEVSRVWSVPLFVNRQSSERLAAI